MDIVGALTTVGQALDIAKKLKDMEKGLGEAEFKLQIADLMMKLADAKVALASAITEVEGLKTEIRDLKQKKASRMRTVTYRGYNFGIDANGKQIGRPYCPVCEAKGMQIQLTQVSSTLDMCPSCKAEYRGHPWRLPPDFDIEAALKSAS